MRSSLNIPLKNIKIHVATNDTKESIIKRSNPCVMKLIIIYGDINENIETNITLTITSLKNIRIIYGVYCSKNFIECKFKLVKERFYYKQILGFSGWNIIGSSSVVLTNYGINILLNIFFGVAVNAARGITTQVDNALNQFVSNFVMALNPQITKSYASGNRE